MDNRPRECDAIISSNQHVTSFLDVLRCYNFMFDRERIDSSWMTYYNVNGSVQGPQRCVQNVMKVLKYRSICEECCLKESFERALKELSRMMD